MITRDQLNTVLARTDACYESSRWVDETDGSPEELWSKCKRGDWLIWIAVKTKAISLYEAADLACRALVPYALRSAKLSDLADRLEALPQVVDETTALTARDLCREARRDAYAAYATYAAYAANAAAAADAANAAADAANAAAAAANAAYATNAAYAADAYDAAYAAYAADAANAADAADAANAAAAAWRAALEKARAEVAGIVRSRIAWSRVEAALTKYVGGES